MVRTGSDKESHDRLVRSLIGQLEKEEYSVKKADLPGYPGGKPDSVFGKIPDIFAVKGGTELIGEVETCESIRNPGPYDTEAQWKAFSKSPKLFHVGVPDECMEEAKKRAKEWNVTVDRWW